MKTLAGLLALLLCASSCTTVKNPAKPGVDYASIPQCQADNPPVYVDNTDPSAMAALEQPSACKEVLNKPATVQAAGVGLTVLYLLVGIAAFALILAGAR